MAVCGNGTVESPEACDDGNTTSGDYCAGDCLAVTGSCGDSVDYPVDVWLSYGGGYLDLQTGATWNDPFEHCFGPSPSEAYADITTACSQFNLKIHCL